MAAGLDLRPDNLIHAGRIAENPIAGQGTVMLHSSRWLLGWLAPLFVVALVSADPDSGRRTREIDQIVAESFKADGPGAAVLVVHQGKVVHSKGYGLADLDTKTPSHAPDGL